MTPTAGAALAAAHRMVDWVHRDAAVVRAPTEPASSPRLADRDVLVVLVRDLTHRGPALDVNLPNFAAREFHGRVRAFLRHELSGNAGRAHELCAAALLHLHAVHHGAHGDVLK